jgi:hypothetical protein
LLDSCRPSWLQRPGRSLPAPESFAPSIGSPLSWVQTSRIERFPGFKSTAFVSRLKAFPNIPQNTEINSVAVCPLTMIWFPELHGFSLFCFFWQKNYITEEPLKLIPFTTYLHFCQSLKLTRERIKFSLPSLPLPKIYQACILWFCHQ